MWSLFEQGELKPESKLTGVFIKDETSVNVEDIIEVIEDAREEAIRRQLGRDEAQAAGGN
jgi:RIO kinase 1